MIVKLNSGYSRIPEGVHTFEVTEVDDSKLADFGKITITLKCDKGTNKQTYTLLRNGASNEAALTAFSTMAKAVLNEDVDTIDPQDLVGHKVQATVSHEKYEKQDGSEGTATRLSYWTPVEEQKSSSNGLDLDEILG